jgi:hypothetical protein
MKWKNQRTKIFAAISGVLVVVVAALVVFTQTSGTELFGTTQVQITPYESTIQLRHSTTLKMTAAAGCTWSNPEKILGFKDDVASGPTVTVIGNFGGRAKVIASCGSIVGVGYVNVTIPTPTPTKAPLSIQPLNPRIRPATAYETSVFFKAVNASGECQWSTNPSNVGWALINGGYEIHFQSQRIGTYTVTAKCGGETATSALTVTLDIQ